MEHLIRGLFEGGMQDYDCSVYRNPPKVERRLVFGIACIVYGTVTIAFYLLCMRAMLEKHQKKLSCYPIMIYIGVVDIATLLLNSVLSGILFIEGAVYCTHPVLIYVAGCFALSLWCCSCLTCFLLICNRLYALWYGSTGWKPFYTKVSLLVCSAYFLYFFIFTRPLLHNSEKHAWFFDPMIRTDSKLDYSNESHSINNEISVFLMTVSYIVFVIILRAKYRKHGQKFSVQKNPIVIQAVLMCSFDMIASVIYVIMQRVSAPHCFILAGQISWDIRHGCAAFIYVTLNKTIRRRVFTYLHLYHKPNTILPLPTVSGRGMGLNKTPEQIALNNLNLPKCMLFTSVKTLAHVPNKHST